MQKTFYVVNYDRARYFVSFHDGVSQHKDGSAFFDMRIFKNKKKVKIFTDELKASGYVEYNSFAAIP